MSKFLATAPGKYGDILWTLPTLKALSELTGEKYDFACMPMYSSLLPLIQAQPYIDKAFVDNEWIFMHSNYGDQPWNPQKHTACITNKPIGGYECKQGWDRCWHLGYRSHPGKSYNEVEMQLIDFVAYQQGISLKNPLPFLAVPANNFAMLDPFVAYAFNDGYVNETNVFKEALFAQTAGISLVDVTTLPWLEATEAINSAVGFVGCRSANYVIAHGLKKQMVTYEPHPARNREGHLGFVFGCSYGNERCIPLLMPPATAAGVAASTVKNWIKEATNENVAS